MGVGEVDQAFLPDEEGGAGAEGVAGAALQEAGVEVEHLVVLGDGGGVRGEPVPAGGAGSAAAASWAG